MTHEPRAQNHRVYQFGGVLSSCEERHEQATIIRPKDMEIFDTRSCDKTKRFSASARCRGHLQSGLLEDEAHMAVLIGMCVKMGIAPDRFALGSWPFTLNLAMGRFYSFKRYPSTLLSETCPVSSQIDDMVVFCNPTYCSVHIYFITEAVAQQLLDIATSVDGGLLLHDNNFTCTSLETKKWAIGNTHGSVHDICQKIYAMGFGPRAMHE